MHFHVVHVKVRGNSRKISNFRICNFSISKMGTLWPKRASTRVRILPIPTISYHFFLLILVSLSKLDFNLALQTPNSIFLKIFSTWLSPMWIGDPPHHLPLKSFQQQNCLSSQRLDRSIKKRPPQFLTKCDLHSRET